VRACRHAAANVSSVQLIALTSSVVLV